MKHYRHFSLPEREEISRGLAAKKSIRSIAVSLGRSPSSLSREIRRNDGCLSGYRAYSAHLSARYAAMAPRRPRKLSRGTWLWFTVYALMRNKRWSPEQIAAWLRETYPDDVSKHVSHETIYRTIYVLPRGTLRQELIDCLRQHRKRRRKRRRFLCARERGWRIPNMVSIHDRPAEVDARDIPGHWEGDLVIGKHQVSAVGTLVERTSRKILLCSLEGRTSDDVVAAFERRLRRLPGSLRSTLTYDRGMEMAHHEDLTKRVKMKVYFCDPQSPWQRGTNENTNGLVRDFFPKGTDFRKVSAKELHRVEELLNTRPRKCLGWKTPNEVFSSHLRVALKS